MRRLGKKTKRNPKLTAAMLDDSLTSPEDILAKVQEVYFDMVDLLDQNELDDEIEGFQEFENLREHLVEQVEKIVMIEEGIERLSKRKTTRSRRMR